MTHKKKHKRRGVAAVDLPVVSGFEFDIGDNDSLVHWWIHGDGEPQPVIWPMRLRLRQGNQSDGTNMIGYSPRRDH